MTEQHRAYHNQWTYVRRQAELGHSDPSCILELLSRVEALEAGLTAVSLELRDRVEALEAAEPAESNDPARPNSSLVGRRPWAAMSFRGAMLLPPPDCADPDLWIAERIYEMGFTAGKNAATGNTAPVTRDRDEDAPASSDSLAEEVVDAIADVSVAYGTADKFTCRTGIDAIAHWLDQQKLRIAATELRQEVE